MNSTIRYITGDATQPTGAGPFIIAHICNDIGGWGAGFVLAISRRWKMAEERYRDWHRGKNADAPPFGLGAVQFVAVSDAVTIANMIGQHGIRSKGGAPPIRYEAVDLALDCLAAEALRLGASVHMPRIGCGLAGGTWDRIEPLLQARLVTRGVSVTIYDFATK